MRSKNLEINRRLFATALLLALLITFNSNGYTQNLASQSKITISLADGTPVTLYAQLSGSGARAATSKNYYYLPTQVQLAVDPVTKVPQFLFLKYVTDQRDDQGGVSGALMHFLMQNAFTPQQLNDMQARLSAQVSGAIVKGPVDLYSSPDVNSFTITSAVVNKEGGMTKSLVTSGRAPLQQGGKVAVAANLDKNGAQLLAATFEKTSSVTDLSVNLFYKYYVKVNGLKATFTMDYSKIEEVIKQDSIDGKYRYDWDLFSQDEVTQTWTEMHTAYERFVEKKAITIEIIEGIPNETSAKITEMLFQLFLSMVATPATDKQPPAPPKEDEPYLPGRTSAYDYKLNVIKKKFSSTKKKDVIHLNYDYMMPMELAVTQNLKTFYNAARDNPKCIGSVLLNDQFYQRMDIRFVLDLEAKEMFDQEINFVDVRARRKSGSGYVDVGGQTMDKDYVSKNGITTQLTYAPGSDNNREIYQYKTQWSLRGGNVYPATPQWENGQMQAVTLRAPVSPRIVEFEADLDKLKAVGIVRATLQIRYKKFGQEMEENLHLSVSSSEKPLISKMIFMDRDTRGYAYRLIFNHQASDKLALPWTAKINDNYVYAVIPDDLSNNSSELFIKAVDAAKTIVAPGPDGKVTTDKILDQFKEILTVVKTN